MKNYKPTSLLPKSYPLVEHALDRTQEFRVDGLSLELEIIKKLANPYDCPIEFLPQLAHAFGSDFYWELENLTESQQREMVANSLRLHRQKGTLWAIKKVMEILGVETEVVEWWQDDKLLSDLEIKPIEPYTFIVVIDVVTFYTNTEKFMNEMQQRRLLKYLTIYKNVRSYFDMYLKISTENQIGFGNFADTTEIDVEECETKDFEKKTTNELGAVGYTRARDTAIVEMQNRNEKHQSVIKTALASFNSITEVVEERIETDDYRATVESNVGVASFVKTVELDSVMCETNPNKEVRNEMLIPIFISMQEVVCL
jgi:phage tail P2-like protein